MYIGLSIQNYGLKANVRQAGFNRKEVSLGWAPMARDNAQLNAMRRKIEKRPATHYVLSQQDKPVVGVIETRI